MDRTRQPSERAAAGANRTPDAAAAGWLAERVILSRRRVGPIVDGIIDVADQQTAWTQHCPVIRRGTFRTS